VCYPTTPAQYFHLLRRQAHQDTVRPLVVMTPKSLLRLPAATSTIEELTTGGFQPVIDDRSVADVNAVKRVVLCSGKVFYDVEAGREDAGNPADVAVVRLEQFYPFPTEAIRAVIARYPNATEIVWTQEEPQNMGGWHFVADRLRAIAGENIEVTYNGRTPSASPATGSYSIHELEQKAIVEHALGRTAAPASDEISAASEPEVSEKIAPASA
jgi:2-oxoglutarate dehydrogenase E1 component